MNQRFKRLLRLLLALTMVFFLMIPASVSAANNSGNTVELEVGQTAKLKVSGFYQKTTWETSDQNVATVSNDGTVTGIAPGTATITATSKGYFWGKTTITKFTVTVTAPEESEKIEVRVGESCQLTVATSGGSVTWKSSDPDIAKVDDNGLVIGVSEGEVTITATEKKVVNNPIFRWFPRFRTVTVTTDFEVIVLPAEEPKPTYTVTFDSNGGSKIENQNVAEGKIATKPEDPTREGYTFKGWYSDEKLTTAYDFTTPVTSDITLYAGWEKIVKYYTVTFNSNGGSEVEEQTVQEGETATKPEDPTKEGCTFAGWYSDEELTAAYDFTTPVNGNMTLYAKWEAVVTSNLRISIDQKNDTVIDIRQSLSGSFVLDNAGLDSIVCSVTNSEYADMDHEIGNVVINESTGAWELEDVRLYPGANDITMTIQDNNGDQATASITLTYDSGTLATYRDDEVVILDENGNGYINDVLLVSIDASQRSTSPDEIAKAICDEIGGEVIGQLNGAGMYQIRIQERSYDELTKLTERVSGMSGVASSSCEYIIPMSEEEFEVVDEVGEEAAGASSYARSSAVTPNDPWGKKANGWDENNPSGYNWWVEAVRAPSAWSYADRMKDIKIGIVDAGIDTEHPDLSISKSLNQNVQDNHGSHVAGIIGATANNNEGITGMVWKKNLIHYDLYRGAEYTSTSEIAGGVNKLIEDGAKVINDSNGCCLDSKDVSSVGEWIASLIHNWASSITDDFLIVQAAGNDTVDSRRSGFCASVTDSRALEHIIIVAAAQEPVNGSYTLADFSNYGEGVTVAAPGCEILSAIAHQQYGLASGTSMAAPIVTGVAAMVWSLDSTLSAGEVKQIIVDTATKPVSGYDTDTRTYYMVDACAAVEVIANMGTASGCFVNVESESEINKGLQAQYKVHKDTESGDVVYTGNSKYSGSFRFKVPEGDYVVEVTGDNFITGYVPVTVIAGEDAALGNIYISGKISKDDYRVVLRWGKSPSDLDAHLRAVDRDGVMWHAYYGQDGSGIGLDKNDTDSYGPETITITRALDRFKFSVHNYSDRNVASSSDSAAYNLSQSGAEVQLYKGNTRLRVFNVPENSAGNVWNVFTLQRISIDGEKIDEITEINSFEFISEPKSVGKDSVYQ